MTRTSSWLFILSLALAAAGAVGAKQSKACTTILVDRRGTRTHKAVDQTTTIVKSAKRCTSTATVFTTPKARTITSAYPVYATRVVDLPQETDVFTSTKWSFDFVFPTTTSTEVSTPTVTEMQTIKNPDDVTIQTTSYTLQGPPPPPRPQRRDSHPRDLNQRASKKTKVSPVQGKDIYCHTEKTVTTSLPQRPCKTITTTSKAPRKTVVTNIPLYVTVTRTRTPPDATSIEYELQESTITAPLRTERTTILAPASTTTSTVVAAVATEIVVVPEYQQCKPDNFGLLYAYSPGNALSARLPSRTASDATSCCHAAASMAGAAWFRYHTDTGACDISYSQYADMCPTTSYFTLSDVDRGSIVGNLQCSSSST